MQSSKPIKGVLRISACVASSMLAATALSETVINLAEQVWTGKYDLGTLQLHGDKLEGWLEDVDFMTYSSVYGAKGTAALERPNTIRVP